MVGWLKSVSSRPPPDSTGSKVLHPLHLPVNVSPAPSLLVALLCLVSVPLARAEDVATSSAPGVASSAPTQALSLEDAVRLAIARGHSVRIERFNVPIARAGLSEAWGKFDAKITASYSESLDQTPLTPFSTPGLARSYLGERSDTSSVGLEGLAPWGLSYRFGADARKLRNEGSYSLNADGTSAWAGLSVTLPLLRDFGPASMTQVRVARTNLSISEWEFRSSLEDTVDRVIYAYTELVLAESRLRIADKSLELARRLSSENKRRQEVGTMSEYDVLSAEARVAFREEASMQAIRGADYARNALRALISEAGVDVLSAPSIIVSAPSLPPESAVNPAADLHVALEKRPDYRRAQLVCRRGAEERGLAINQLLPRVDLVGSYGYNGLGAVGATASSDIRSRDNPNWSAGMQVSIPIGSSAERGRYRSATLRLRQNEATLKKLEQDIALQIANAAAQLDSTRHRVVAASRARELNQRALEAELKKLNAGTGSTFSVLYQQDQLGYAEDTEAYARAAHTRATSEYDRATGRTLDSHNILPSP